MKPSFKVHYIISLMLPFCAYEKVINFIKEMNVKVKDIYFFFIVPLKIKYIFKIYLLKTEAMHYIFYLSRPMFLNL